MTEVITTEKITETSPVIEVGQYWYDEETCYVYLVVSGMAGEYPEEVEVFSLVNLQHGYTYRNVEKDIEEIFGDDICRFVLLKKVEISFTK